MGATVYLFSMRQHETPGRGIYTCWRNIYLAVATVIYVVVNPASLVQVKIWVWAQALVQVNGLVQMGGLGFGLFFKGLLVVQVK